MRNTLQILALLAVTLFAAPLRAQTASPAPATPVDATPLDPGTNAAALDTDDAFAQQIDLSPLASLEVQHLQTLKTIDSLSRQTMFLITGSSHGPGLHGPIYALLDMTFRPERYRDVALIRIQNVPLRQDFRQLDLSDDAKDRIVRTGHVSLAFLQAPAVSALLGEVQASAITKADAIEQIVLQADSFQALSSDKLPLLRVIPPVAADDSTWKTLAPDEIAELPDPARQGADQARQLLSDLRQAWRNRDVAAAQQRINSLAQLLPTISPARYPSAAKRKTEVIYNKLSMMTLPGAALYFAAFVAFLVASRAGLAGARTWALRLFILAWCVHVSGILVRWWLIRTSVGNYFESIPIKNEFESIMMSAFFGVTVALILELRFRRALFGAAGSFVGGLSLVALFAAPFVTGMDLGGSLGAAQGVLMSYWLYIHVVAVTASYALITMGFLLSAWWLVRYYLDRDLLTGATPYQLCADAAPPLSVTRPSGADILQRTTNPSSDALAPAISVSGALTQLLTAQSPPRPTIIAQSVALDPPTRARQFLATLDAANIVVLQLAFWVLGAGIIFGAIWADQSWGRPWGWDPKETFALITWIVYLMVVHVRVATDNKAWWTSVLSVLGFGVMLFNWIGVNFFLVGLHSYA